MNDIFLTQIDIRQIRHLHDIHIPLSETERKHLILTGKNGSGKTSVLEVLRDYFQYSTITNYRSNSWLNLRNLVFQKNNEILQNLDLIYKRIFSIKENKTLLLKNKSTTLFTHFQKIRTLQNSIINLQDVPPMTIKMVDLNGFYSFIELINQEISIEGEEKVSLLLSSFFVTYRKLGNELIESIKTLLFGYNDFTKKIASQIIAPLNIEPTSLFNSGKFIIAYFGAKRQININIPQGINKIDQKEKFDISEQAGKDFLQFLVNMKADRSFARDDNNMETVQKIDDWFELFTTLLAEIFEDTDIKLQFNSKDYTFEIITKDNIALNFTTLSDGYSAIFNLISELMMRMEKHKTKLYDVQGIVLIDEIETHLHIDLQKKILPFLTKVFPKIQFIVTTHSPFVLSSEANTVIFDLEKQILVEDMSGYSLDSSIVESYYNSDKYSQILKSKVERYETLFLQPDLTDEEEDELMDLKLYFKDLPQFLSPELSVKLHQIHTAKSSAK